MTTKMVRISHNGRCDLMIDWDGKALAYKVVRHGNLDNGERVSWVSMAGRRTGGRICDLAQEWATTTGGRCDVFFRGKPFASAVQPKEHNHTLAVVHAARVVAA